MKLLFANLFIVLFVLTGFTSFAAEPTTTLAFAQKMQANRMSLAELRAVKSFKTSSSGLTFKSCDIFVKPGSSVSEPFEFSVKDVNVDQDPMFKDMLSKLQPGDRIYIEKIKVASSNKAEETLSDFYIIVTN